MNTKITNAIKLFVQSNNKPSLTDLVEADWPKLKMVTNLVAKLTGIYSIANIDKSTGVAEFVSPSGQQMLHLERLSPNQISVGGDFAIQLRALLLAIRIHEVESYDWVLLPPDMRQRKVAQAIADEGINMAQYRHVSALLVV